MQVTPPATKNPYWFAPSILSADFARLGEDVARVVQAGGDLVHFDVMDNHYVPNLTFGPMILKALRSFGITAPMDVHLMVEPVDALIESFSAAGANYISFHPEASRHVDRSLDLIRAAGVKTGLVLNPGTPLSLIEPVLHKLDMLLLMTVNPGFGGQKFIPYVLEKVAAARALIDEKGLATRLEVDGGVNVDTIYQLAKAGADTFVAGSAIFGAADYRQAIELMRAQLARV
jgi:ribulose-phosphate 3-epimerase